MACVLVRNLSEYGLGVCVWQPGEGASNPRPVCKATTFVTVQSASTITVAVPPCLVCWAVPVPCHNRNSTVCHHQL